MIRKSQVAPWVFFVLILATGVSPVAAADDAIGIAGLTPPTSSAITSETATQHQAGSEKAKAVLETKGKTVKATAKKGVEDVAEAHVKVRQLTGQVTEITGDRLHLIKGKQSHVFHVGSGTVVKSGKAHRTLADVKIGDKVTTKYVEARGVLMARSIHLKGNTQPSSTE